MLLYHMLIFIQYFCFLFDISSVICWTQAKEERGEMEIRAEAEESLKTTNSDITSHKCNQCSFSSISTKALELHIRIHTGEKQQKCNQCDFSTADARNLKEHIRIHTGEKPNKCNQCNYSTSNASNLIRHMRKHSGEKPNKCDQCNYSSSEAGALRKHMRTHSGEKPYKCDQCLCLYAPLFLLLKARLFGV